MKTIQMTIDERLLKLVDKLSRARKTSRSAFIRDALEADIRRQRGREDEIRHAAGYARTPAAPREFDVWLGQQDRRSSWIFVARPRITSTIRRVLTELELTVD